MEGLKRTLRAVVQAGSAVIAGMGRYPVWRYGEALKYWPVIADSIGSCAFWVGGAGAETDP